MSEHRTVAGIEIVTSEDVPRGEIHVGHLGPVEIDMDSTGIRLRQCLRVTGRIVNVATPTPDDS